VKCVHRDRAEELTDDCSAVGDFLRALTVDTRYRMSVQPPMFYHCAVWKRAVFVSASHQYFNKLFFVPQPHSFLRRKWSE
jgi:hypothetical protein